MNLLTSLALLGFVSRNIAMPIVLMQLPEGTDPKKINGTMFMIPGDEEFVGPPGGGGGKNRTLTVVVLPTEALNGLDLALPGLSGRRNFLFGNKNGIQTKVFRSKSDPREPNSTTVTIDSPLGERSNNFDPKDIPFFEDWNRSSSGQEPAELDMNYDDAEQDFKATSSSSPPPYAPQDETDPSSEPWDIRSNRRDRGQEKGQKEDKNKRRGHGTPSKKPKKQPNRPIVEESTDDLDTESEPDQRPSEGDRQPSYGSRRTVWGYPTQGQVPYPSYAAKPYPKERPRSQEPGGQSMYPINSCSGCPSTQYPVTSQTTFYPTGEQGAGQQETFITLPDNEEYSGYDQYPSVGNFYGSGQSSYAASSMVPSLLDYPTRYDSAAAEAMMTSSESSSSSLGGGSLLELPFRSRIPSLLNAPMSTEPSMSQSSAQPPRSYHYPMSSMVDGRGQVSGYYIQTRPSPTIRGILERLINDPNNRYSDLESVYEVSTGE